MNVVETVLVYVVPPAALYGGVALLVAGPKLARRPRYRVGQPWTFAPMWWTANPEGSRLPPPSPPAEIESGASDSGARGGARGNW